MKTRISNISAESVTTSDSGIWADSTCLVKGVKMVMKSIGERGERIDKIRQPKSYSWQPKEDITAYELAQCLPALLISIKGLLVQSEIERLPDNCKRHFTEE